MTRHARCARRPMRVSGCVLQFSISIALAHVCFLLLQGQAQGDDSRRLPTPPDISSRGSKVSLVTFAEEENDKSRPSVLNTAGQEHVAALREKLRSLLQQEYPTELRELVAVHGRRAQQLRNESAGYAAELQKLRDTGLQLVSDIGATERRLKRVRTLVETVDDKTRMLELLRSGQQNLQSRISRYRGAPASGDLARLAAFSREHAQVTTELYSLQTRSSDIQHQAVRELVQVESNLLTYKSQLLDELIGDKERYIQWTLLYRQLLEDGNRYLDRQLFWFPDTDRLDGQVIPDAARGATVTLGRLQSLFSTEIDKRSSLGIWFQISVLLLAIPLVLRSRRALRRRIDRGTEQSSSTTIRSGFRQAFLILVRTSLWPLYLLLALNWWYLTLPTILDDSELQAALILHLRRVVLLLWVLLLGLSIFRQGGLAERRWGLEPRVCNWVKRGIIFAQLAAMTLLLPSLILSDAPGSAVLDAVQIAADANASSTHVLTDAVATQALSRALFFGFELAIVALALFGIPFGGTVLRSLFAAESISPDGPSRTWKGLYVAVVVGAIALVVLDGSGYHSTAIQLWADIGKALLLLSVVGVIYRLTSSAIDLCQDVAATPDGPTDSSAGEDATENAIRIGQARWLARVGLLAAIAFGVTNVFEIDQGLFDILDTVRLAAIPTDGQTGDASYLTLGDVVQATLIFAGCWVIVSHLESFCEAVFFARHASDRGTEYAVLTLLRYVVVLVGLAWGLSALHIRWSTVQWILAGASVGLGFGLRQIIENFACGLILLVERLVKVDDFITVGSETGKVLRITIRSTTIRNLDRQRVVFPNEALVTGNVINWSLDDHVVRVKIPIGVAYGSDMELVEKILKETTDNGSGILKDPHPQIFFVGFGDSSLNWEIRIFVADILKRYPTQHALLLSIDEQFRQHGIEVPFPQRDLHLRSADAEIDVHQLPKKS